MIESIRSKDHAISFEPIVRIVLSHLNALNVIDTERGCQVTMCPF
jgi:hypothetical protein